MFKIFKQPFITNGVEKLKVSFQKVETGIGNIATNINQLPIPKRIPISVVSGLSSIVVFWTFILFSFALYPDIFNPIGKMMSDLGSYTQNPAGASFFNIGCILTGIAFFPFFIGLYEWYIGGLRNKILTILTQISGILCAICIIMIGLTPIDNLGAHTFWAVNFFTISVFTTLFPSIALYKYKFTRNIAKFGFIASTINIIFRIFILIPIFEWLSIAFSFLFILLVIVSMQKRIKRFRIVRKANLKI